MNPIIPKRVIRVKKRPFNAHHECDVRNCGNRAIARVQLKTGCPLDVCEICLSNCPAETTIIEKA